MLRVGLSHDPLRFYLSFNDVSKHDDSPILHGGWSLLYTEIFRLRSPKKRRKVISWKKIPDSSLLLDTALEIWFLTMNALLCYESKKYSLPRFFVISIPNKALKRDGVYCLFARCLISS